VLDVGQGVTDLQPGDRVISNGNHAEIICVPRNLVAKVPENVTDEEASFVVLSSIALQGIRLLQPCLGEKIMVFGMGLIGLVTVPAPAGRRVRGPGRGLESAAAETGGAVRSQDGRRFPWCGSNRSGQGLDRGVRRGRRHHHRIC
jgi:hypothetical protein